MTRIYEPSVTMRAVLQACFALLIASLALASTAQDRPAQYQLGAGDIIRDMRLTVLTPAGLRAAESTARELGRDHERGHSGA